MGQSLGPMSTAVSNPPSETRSVRAGIGTPQFALLLGVFLLLCFPEVLAGLKTFVYRDFGLFGYPLAYHWRESFWAGELPLWNPYSNCGLPFLAQWNTMVLYPLSLIYVLLPLPWSLNFFCLFHLFLAGLGMYVLARNWTGSPLGAAIAGTAFAFNGLSLCALMWPNNVSALGWMPWVVLTATRAFRDGGCRTLASAALVGAMQVLTGAPEVILFTWIFVAGFCVVETWQAEHKGRVLARFGWLALLVAGLSAAQLLPFGQLVAESHRDTNYGSRWSMPGWGWANLVVPLFRMSQFASGVYLQTEQGWTSSYYVGIGALALAVAAIIWLRDRRVLVLGIVAVVGLILALGDKGWLYLAVRKLMPLLGSMRYPVKFVTCATFAIPLLAAFMVARLDSGAVYLRRLLIVGGGAFAGVALIVVVAYGKPMPYEEWSTTLWSGITRAFFLGAILAGLWWRRRLDSHARRTALALGIVSLVWLDGYTHVPSQNPVVHPSVFAPGLLEAEPITPRPALGESRAMLSLAMLDAFATNSPASQSDNMLLMRLWQYENLNLLERIPKVDGFYSLFLSRERDLHFRLYGADGLPRRGLGDFLGVSQVAKQTGDKTFGWSFRENSLPLATLNANPTFEDAAATLTNLMLSTFDPRQTVFLLPEARAVLTATNRVPGRIVSRLVSANRIRLDVETPEPNLLVIAQSHYPAWSAYVDGKAVPIHRANFAFQAVEVPAGKHTCELRYRDVRFRLGLAITVLSGAACMALWLAGRRKSP